MNEHIRVPAIQERIEQALGQDLVTIHLIDIYSGKQLTVGTRNFTFRVGLTAAEVSQALYGEK